MMNRAKYFFDKMQKMITLDQILNEIITTDS